MSLHSMFDASVPPSSAYPGAEAVAGYIGGNTPHVWTPAEWQRFADLIQFPIWVGYLEGDPLGHATDAVAAMGRLGWSPFAANRRAVLLDFEAEIDPPWVDTFAGEVWHAGYQTFIYGSESTIVGNPGKEGRWIALYDGTPDIPSVAGAIGHQYRANVPWGNTQVDLSVITDEMLAHGGIGPRHG